MGSKDVTHMNTLNTKATPLEIDGAAGGGQILRSALSLSMITGRPLRLVNIRAGRSRPGLMRQHLTAVNAAVAISAVQCSGNELGSQTLSFRPGPIRAGDYRFAIGGAGSTVLVLQTLLPTLLYADGPSQVHISGGTHNPLAPPLDFIQQAWLPLLRRMGARVEVELLRHGFAPAGGGELRLHVWPGQLQPLHLPEAGAVLARRARALIADVPWHVAQRELERVHAHPEWQHSQRQMQRLDDDEGPGNILLLELECEQLTCLFSSLGEPRLSAERVADRALRAAQAWLASGAAVDEHLADQLLLPLALAGGGSFSAPRASNHLLTNRAVIEAFLPLRIAIEAHGEQRQNIRITSA
ncbi:MAG: RNA 3'-terminal phosphate cyclase [Stenotrophomonas maltophilia]|nr:MAG: RNA 3'-terminal phosphate cyclase [Stenotrophomonas maltophilia]